MEAKATYYQPEVHDLSSEQLKNFIEDDIIATRERFLGEFPDSAKAEATYNVDHDIEAFKTLYKYRFANSKAYQETRDSLVSYTKFQVDKTLRERYKTLGSEYSLTIANSVIMAGKEPLLTIMRRGQQYKRLHNSKDSMREEAEVVGFEEVTQPYLLDDNRKSGDMVVSISRPGIAYKDNFYDIFQVVLNEQGEKSIRVKRFHSALFGKEYNPFISQLNPHHPIPLFTSAEFDLAHPIIVTGNFRTPEEVHALLHKEHDCMKEEEFEGVAKAVDQLIDEYINRLVKNPYARENIFEAKRSIYNGADEIVERIKNTGKGTTIFARSEDRREPMFRLEDIMRLGARKVMEIETGCGVLGGDAFGNPFSERSIFENRLRATLPQSVADFGFDKDDLGDREFPCPACEYKNRRPYNQKINLCQNENCPDPKAVIC